MKTYNLKEKHEYYMKLAKEAYKKNDVSKCKYYFIKSLEKVSKSINKFNSRNGVMKEHIVPPNPKTTFKVCIENGFSRDFKSHKWFEDRRSKDFLNDD